MYIKSYLKVAIRALLSLEQAQTAAECEKLTIQQRPLIHQLYIDKDWTEGWCLFFVRTLEFFKGRIY
ncbi:hypothetical protein ABE26_09030 [Cytobacillus firmus]|nr:hypothetical protein [Cytobacillus firmus]